MKYKVIIDVGKGRKVVDYIEEGRPNIEFIIQNMIDAAKILKWTGYDEHPLKKEEK